MSRYEHLLGLVTFSIRVADKVGLAQGGVLHGCVPCQSILLYFSDTGLSTLEGGDELPLETVI